jgi:hypothetical protein
MTTYRNDYDNDIDDMQYTNEVNTTTGKKLNPRRYFTSNKPNTFIRNAITGVPYPYLVGSKDSLRLFKVVDTLGTCDIDGRLLFSSRRKDLSSPQPNQLFYDSPDQFSRHLKMDVDKDLVARWYVKKAELFPVKVDLE